MDNEGRSSGLPSVICYNRHMEYNDEALELYDMYTKQQLLEIASANNVQFRNADKKLNIARAIAVQTSGEYVIPKDMTPATRVPESRLKSLNPKDRREYLEKKADMIDEQWRNVLTDEEFAERPLTNIFRRANGNTPLDPQEKIAVYSSRNIFWDKVGSLSRGYSFITREEANMWKRLRGVREATPEEVASHFDL